LNRERDVESQYDYFGARYYDARIGRWLAVDPLAEKYANSSAYAYTLGNPVGFVDVDGRKIVPRGSRAQKAQQRSWFAEMQRTPDGKGLYDFVDGIPEVVGTSIGRLKNPRLNAQTEHKGRQDEDGDVQWSGAEITFDPSKATFNIVGTPGHELFHVKEAKEAKEANRLNEWLNDLKIKEKYEAAENRARQAAAKILIEYVIMLTTPIVF
jgi:RHS repeat-associated protein